MAGTIQEYTDNAIATANDVLGGLNKLLETGVGAVGNIKTIQDTIKGNKQGVDPIDEGLWTNGKLNLDGNNLLVIGGVLTLAVAVFLVVKD